MKGGNEIQSDKRECVGGDRILAGKLGFAVTTIRVQVAFFEM